MRSAASKCGDGGGGPLSEGGGITKLLTSRKSSIQAGSTALGLKMVTEGKGVEKNSRSPRSGLQGPQLLRLGRAKEVDANRFRSERVFGLF